MANRYKICGWGERENFENSKIDRCEVNSYVILLKLRQGRPEYVCKWCINGCLKQFRFDQELMRSKIIFLVSRIFGPECLGLVGRCRWFVLGASRATGTNASVCV